MVVMATQTTRGNGYDIWIIGNDTCASIIV
jgi:hypothetical protein